MWSAQWSARRNCSILIAMSRCRLTMNDWLAQQNSRRYPGQRPSDAVMQSNKFMARQPVVESRHLIEAPRASHNMPGFSVLADLAGTQGKVKWIFRAQS